MARFLIPSSQLRELKDPNEVSEILNKKEFVLIVFNTKYPDLNDIEHKFNTFRGKYESDKNLHVYKCLISMPNQQTPLTQQYKVQELATFIFFHKGKEIGRWTDPEETNAGEPSSPNASEEKLKEWIESCFKGGERK